MLTKTKLRALRNAWRDNMTDVEVGPLLEHIAEQEARIAQLESENDRLCANLASNGYTWISERHALVARISALEAEIVRLTSRVDGDEE